MIVSKPLTVAAQHRTMDMCSENCQVTFEEDSTHAASFDRGGSIFKSSQQPSAAVNETEWPARVANTGQDDKQRSDYYFTMSSVMKAMSSRTRALRFEADQAEDITDPAKYDFKHVPEERFRYLLSSATSFDKILKPSPWNRNDLFQQMISLWTDKQPEWNRPGH